MGVVQALRELRAPLNEEPQPKWNPSTCLIMAQHLEGMSAVALSRGDRKTFAWCVGWSAWWRDRAEGKPDDETFPPGPGELP